MSWFRAIWLAEIHRETYAAILDSWIPHGKKGEFASNVGISREYLSYLCALDQPDEGLYPVKRLPSDKMVKKIADALPASKEIKQSLVENMELAHINNSQAHYIMKKHLAQRHVSELVSELNEMHGKATFGSNLQEVKRVYRVLINTAKNSLLNISPEIYPASFTQVCLLIHDAQCVLDRADDALRCGKLARLVIESADNFEAGFEKEQINDLKINAIRSEAVAYHNLGLDKKAIYYNEMASTTLAYQNKGEFWKPFVGKDLLTAMLQIPRYSIRAAKDIAHNIENICEQNNDEFMLLLVREAWLRHLIKRNKLKQAEQLFRQELNRVPHLPQSGSLHRAQLLKSGALLFWKLGDMESWSYQIKETLQLIYLSGLKHQFRQIYELYGQELTPIVEEIT